MNLTHISEVKVGVLQEDGTGRQVPVSESPFYKTLSQYSRAPFNNYFSVLQKVSGTPEKEMCFYEFSALFFKIKGSGFEASDPKIRFDENLVCLDGHHRLAILLHLHGENLALEIVNNEVQSVWVKSSK